MAVTINTNVGSLTAQKNLSTTQAALSKSFARLSSGYRINSASDDAAGLGDLRQHAEPDPAATPCRPQHERRYLPWRRPRTARSGRSRTSLGRMRELATQGANGSLQTSDRAYLATEFKSLQSE